MPFKKGQSGNPGGVRSLAGRKLTAELKRILEENDGEGHKKIAQRLIDDALNKDDRSVGLKAIKEILDRIDGRAPMQQGRSDGDGLMEQFRMFALGLNAGSIPAKPNGAEPLALSVVHSDEKSNGRSS